jgi:hypothetical protein
MATLYWLSLVVGGGLVLLSVFGDLLHLDMPDFHTDADAWHILSLRTATYSLFGFGAAGLLLGLAGHGAVATLAGAAAAGAAAGTISSLALRYVRGHQSGDVPDDASLVGLPGRVVLPLQRGGTGKIVVTRAGRELELLASAFDTPSDEAVETWSEIVVVEVSEGIALVTPYPSGPGLPSGEG